ncbi:Uncharacterised protein [Mycobacteroides abscessus subsp. abscessus]|nr:Uncharacterised protein [Mycobacteroides abscessus subsp. abscessus]
MRRGGAEALGDPDRGDDGFGGEDVAHPIVGPFVEEGFDHHRDVLGCTVVDGAGVGFERRCGRRVTEVDPQQGLREVDAVAGHAGGGVTGEAVVDLEGRAGEAAAVHRPDGELAFEAAEEREVVEDVGSAEDAVDAGTGECRGEPVEEVLAVGHGQPVVADGVRSAGGVVGGDDEELRIGTADRAAGAGGPRGGDRCRVVEARVAEAGERRGGEGGSRHQRSFDVEAAGVEGEV